MADVKKTCNCSAETCECAADIEQLQKELNTYKSAYKELEVQLEKLTFLYNTVVESFLRYKSK